MNLSERITFDPQVCIGKPAIRGKRITVKTILEYIAAGETVQNILNDYPMLEKDDIKASLQFAAEQEDSVFGNLIKEAVKKGEA